MKKIKEFYSFDDVLIEPNFSNIIPKEADLTTKLTKSIVLNIPLISAAMDTVTEHKMAINMALNGGIGAVHKSLSIDLQCQEVSKVKKYEVDITKYNKACVDTNNSLRVLAAVGTGEEALKRAKSLIKANVDAIIIDTSHGHSQNVIDTIKEIKNISPSTEIIAGNIATKNAALALLYAGADTLKVGIGPGSICTTRVVSGVGSPQLSAILEVAEICKTKDSFLIADGGIKFSGDLAKAIAAGADCVMLGSLLAGTDVAPGKIINIKNEKYKKYRGMGSVEAMKSGSADRYFQKGEVNLVPQGVEGYIKYKGSMNEVLNQLLGGLTSAMGYTGNKNIDEMKKNCNFIKITPAGIREGHIHSLDKSEPAINYKNNI
ncbi:IMP dehydrogenase [Rickettsiales endosymbiont of Trichoplax sp. H2]|uniref:IMP dehydrogenase n=1 Tax=Rickettsiales endosymbiont of Trichoplax sp. H2 TaxID=2021221 RepID=UPI0012B33DBB|nr:IMP dehydrogenase [Rickettsiales endosymbiont of Trichoplax sp. H2]MSO13247.1 Inosine-5'-monophosphate dehydrogenase [Rickettsiales endosymbiont of Trichoplax sp. H2]